MTERVENGLYLVADSPTKAIPLLTESGDGDFQLLKEYLYEKGFVLETRDLESFLSEVPEDEIPDYLDTGSDRS